MVMDIDTFEKILFDGDDEDIIALESSVENGSYDYCREYGDFTYTLGSGTVHMTGVAYEPACVAVLGERHTF